MIKVKTAVALAAGAVAAVAIGGSALAAGGDDPSPSPTSGAVEMLPNGDPVQTDADHRPDHATRRTIRRRTRRPARPSRPRHPPRRRPSASSRATSTATISLADAKAIALSAAGGGRVTKVERETEHGRPVYDIEVQAGSVEHDIDVDRVTGEVLRHRTDRDDDRSGSSARTWLRRARLRRPRP